MLSGGNHDMFKKLLEMIFPVFLGINPKFCKDCKWYNSSGDCYSPKNGQTTSLVTGVTKKHIRTCEVNRLPCSGTCGPGARWFEPIERKEFNVSTI